MTRLAMTLDVDLCLGCEACIVACSTENEVPVGQFRIRMRTTTVGTFPDLRTEFRVESCFHCADAPCIEVCPTGATYKTADGVVLVNPAKCTGCKACVVACPYGMRYVHRDGWVDKCTFCDHRVAAGRQPACVETCPTGARVFGDLDDDADPINDAITKARSVSVVNPDTGANPHLFFLNSQFTNGPTERLETT